MTNVLVVIAWCVFAPLYLRAAYREMKQQAREERRARLHGRQDDRDDENLANP